jgi:hypothetical protein
MKSRLKIRRKNPIEGWDEQMRAATTACRRTIDYHRRNAARAVSV